MNNTHFSLERSLREILAWLSKHTKKSNLLVGDYLHRYNLRIFHNLTEEQAIQESLDQGKILLNYFNNIVKDFDLDFNIIGTQSYVYRPDFKTKFKRINDTIETNGHFAQLVEYSIDLFLRRHELIKIPLTEAKELCKKYLIEELVIFELLAEEGLKLNIYPGNQLPIVKELVTGKLKGVSQILEQIEIIEIKFKPINNNH